jgi:hypothetical protein
MEPHAPIGNFRALVDKLTVAFGAAILIIIVAGSWIPRACPLTKKFLVGCPNEIPLAPITAKERAIAAVAHQTITTNEVFFDVASSPIRNRTKVHFYYYVTGAMPDIRLSLKGSDESFKEVAVVNNAFLSNLAWPVVENDQTSLFQQNPMYGSIEDFLSNPPPGSQVVADSTSAAAYGLVPAQYNLLSKSSPQQTVAYVLTTYHRPVRDGVYEEFTYTVDASQAFIDSTGKISWELSIDPSPTPSDPLFLSTVDIEYLHGSQQ